jgi:glyceraldehyde-3-phosphate dehydrogenase/erythrose-4-phosphate dehydrogenase
MAVRVGVNGFGRIGRCILREVVKGMILKLLG